MTRQMLDFFKDGLAKMKQPEQSTTPNESP